MRIRIKYSVYDMTMIYLAVTCSLLYLTSIGIRTRLTRTRLKSIRRYESINYPFPQESQGLDIFLWTMMYLNSLDHVLYYNYPVSQLLGEHMIEIYAFTLPRSLVRSIRRPA